MLFDQYIFAYGWGKGIQCQCHIYVFLPYSAGNYMFKANNRNTKTRCEMCSKLTLKTPERTNGVVLVALLLSLNIFHTLL